MALSTFKILSREEFADYLTSNHFGRNIEVIQNHHTWKPSYANFTSDRGELYWLESIRRTHINDRGWSDIGQNLTTFPNGKIGLCRPLDIAPAGIKGANTGALCIEHFGNFDLNGDNMTDEHRETIITINALLCIKFNINPIKWQIVYHHWYSPTGAKFSEAQINSGAADGLQKTCPGTNFFGGNKITNAEANFFPLIAQKISELKQAPATPTFRQGTTTAQSLNVRSGAGTSFNVVRSLPIGSHVTIYQEDPSGWYKISKTSEEWVAKKYVIEA